MQSNIFSGLFVDQKIITLQRVHSTNGYLRDKLSKSEPFVEGTVIMAVDQYAGKGQQENTWHSEPGKNLTFSILLKPSFLAPDNQFNLNIAISLAVQEALKPILGNDLRIKWPNDIYVGKRKLGGILIENIVQGNLWKYAVVGIGINVNQLDFESLAGRICSIKQLLHADYDLLGLLSELCKAIEKQYLLLKNGHTEEQHNHYLSQLFGMNEIRNFAINGIPVEGKITGVDPKGRLLVDFNGHVTDFGFKEIDFLI